MAIIETKYLLNESIDDFLQKNSLSKKSISQFYTQVKICKEVRYRNINDKKFLKTIRIGNKVRKNIINHDISEAKYEDAKEKKLGKVLKIERYTLKDSETFSINRYKKNLKNIYTLDMKFDSLQEAENYTLADDIKIHVAKDVSDDARYQDKNLALLGNPNKLSYNIHTIYKDIEQERLEDIKDIIFPEMIVSDAVRIVLYKIYHDLNRYHDKLLTKSDIFALEHFREKLKEAKIILDEYKEVFNHNIYKKVSQHLNIIEKTIAVDKDLTLIRANLKLLESSFSEKEVNKFISRIDNRIEIEKAKVKNFFKTREYAIIFKQFNLLLKEQSNVHYSYYSSTTIEQVVKASVKKRFKKLLSLTKEYDECHDMDAYKKMKKALTKIVIILDNFSYLYNKKEYKQLQNLLANLDEELSTFIDLNKRSLIIKTYIRNSNKELKEQLALITKMDKKRKKLEKKIFKKVDKNINILRDNRALF